MALDIRGAVKNTQINKRSLVVVDELLSNAIDSYLTRKKQDTTFVESLRVDIIVEFYPDDRADTAAMNLKITCRDNGAGFDDKQVKAFTTKDTSYKDDLQIAGIGKCRGLGRIQFLHYFRRMRIESIYREGEKRSRRKLNIDTTETKEIDEKSFVKTDALNEALHTEVSLDGIRLDIFSKFFAEKNVLDEFSIEAIKQYVIVNFLQRFVGLKDSLGDFVITFKTIHQSEERSGHLVRSDLPPLTERKSVGISPMNADGRAIGRSESFTISHYKLNNSGFKLRSNLVALCAKSAAIKPITRRYLTTKTFENNDINGFYHLVLVESPYLDEHVNGTRDDFDIPDNDKQTSLFANISFEQIYDEIDDIIDGMISPPDWDRNKTVNAVSQKYGITREMIAEAKIKIRPGNTEESIVKRVMAAYQDKVIGATSAIVDLKTDVANTDPTTAQFRDKVNELAWRYTSSLHDIDMLNLSQLIVRRAAILEILHLAIEKGLPAQNAREKRCDEKFIHNVLFPTGKDSNDTQNHDIWLLNEEYQYFDYIASDKALSTISVAGAAMFDATIDTELEALLDRIYKGKENANKRRPDIAIFGKEGVAIIIELKAPGVPLDEHDADLMEYSVLLASKSKGKLNRFYGYLLGDTLNHIRLRGYTRFPDNNGWFATEKVKDPKNDAQIGSLYSEILFYNDIVERARRRLEVYKQRIGLNFG